MADPGGELFDEQLTWAWIRQLDLLDHEGCLELNVHCGSRFHGISTYRLGARARALGLQDIREYLLGQIHPFGTAEVVRPLNDRVDDDGIGVLRRAGRDQMPPQQLAEGGRVTVHMRSKRRAAKAICRRKPLSEIVRRFYDEVFDRQNLELADTFVAPQF
jgi:hypothetical protein